MKAPAPRLETDSAIGGLASLAGYVGIAESFESQSSFSSEVWRDSRERAFEQAGSHRPRRRVLIWELGMIGDYAGPGDQGALYVQFDRKWRRATFAIVSQAF